MSDIEIKQDQVQETDSDLDKLEEQVSFLEEKNKNTKLSSYEKRIKNIEKRLQALQQTEEVENIRKTFNDAISQEQQWDDLNRKAGTREERIKALETDTFEKMNDLRTLLNTDNYQQYFFSSLNTNPTDEKLRRFCFHVHRMTNEDFLQKFKSFSLESKFSLE